MFCRAPDLRRPRPSCFQTDRCPRRDGRTGGVRHRQAGQRQYFDSRPHDPEAAFARHPRANGSGRCAPSAGQGQRPSGEESRAQQLPVDCRRGSKAGRSCRASPVNRAIDTSGSAAARHSVPGYRRHRQQARHAVAALSGTMESYRWRRFAPLGVAGAEAIEARSVGFSSTHLGAGRNKLFIRGIADSSFSGPTQSPVGQYFGDMRTGYSGPDPDLKLVDMQSVEILEGPQGTLYGSGALGGIVLLKPNMPDLGESRARLQSAFRSPGMAIRVTMRQAWSTLPLGEIAALRPSAIMPARAAISTISQPASTDINDTGITGGRATLSAEIVARLVRRRCWRRPADRWRRQPICRQGQGTTCRATAWSTSPSIRTSPWPAWSSARTAARSAFVRPRAQAGRMSTKISTRPRKAT